MNQLFLGPLTLDLDLGIVEGPTGTTRLTRIELLLVRRLVQANGDSVSRADLLTDVWQLAPTTVTRCVDSTIYRVRRKVELDPTNPVFILRDYGEGYRLVCPVLDARHPTEDETSALIGRSADIQRVQQLLAQDHRAIALIGPVGAGVERLSNACVQSPEMSVFSTVTELMDWLHQDIRHRGILLGDRLGEHNLMVVEVGPVSSGSARDILLSTCREPLTNLQIQASINHTGCLPQAILELARNIDTFGPEFALTMPLLTAPLNKAWAVLTDDQRDILEAIARTPASVPVRALAAIAAPDDLKLLRENCWFVRTHDRFDLTAPARTFVRNNHHQTEWMLLPWIGHWGREQYVASQLEAKHDRPHPDDIALSEHAARTYKTEHATWALLGAAEAIRTINMQNAVSLLTRHINFDRPAGVRSALYALRSSANRVLTHNTLAATDADSALTLARTDHQQMHAHAAVAYASILTPTTALPHLERAISLAKSLRTSTHESAYLAAKGACHRNLGDLRESQHSLERALAASPNVPQRVSVRLRLAMTLADRENIPAALQQLSVGIDDARSENMLTHAALGFANLGFVQLLAGADPTHALTDAQDICVRIGYRPCHGVVVSTQALHAALSGHFEDAERLLYASLDLLPPSPMRGIVQAWLARLELAFCRPSQSFEQCLKLCQTDQERTSAIQVLMDQPSNTWPRTSLVRLAERYHSTCRKLEHQRRRSDNDQPI